MDLRIVIAEQEHRVDPIFLTIAESSKVSVVIDRGGKAMVVCLCTGRSDNLPCVITQNAELAAGAHLHWINITVGNGITQSLVSRCMGEGATCAVDWVCLARGNDQQTLSVHNEYLRSHGGGEITMRGVAEDRARISAHGMIAIGPQGTGTHSYLTQEVLMLDSTAKVDAVPGLEIKTNDVKASHSASISRVTPEDLFYFQSRGIAECNARRMYVEGFLGEILERIPKGAAREKTLGILKKL